jgi:lipopolysaccharide transport system ATP-binding protein
MSDIAIKIENLSKQYRLGVIGTGTLSHDLNRWWKMNILGKEDPYLKIGETNQRDKKGDSDYVWALRDINLEVKQGEILGIIGKNGAGKSTLLKILSRVTKPSTGKITYKGRIASLLEVGTGFHPEMTGRENIYMNGTIMGMTRSEISRKLDEIVDFAGIERYIDTPVKRYSSGMTVRLGFAIAAHLEPEILVVDEVLAVGDAEFQKKAIGKMQDVSKGEGRTVLFVSHNMAAVKQLCNYGVVLRQGRIENYGAIDYCVQHYLNQDGFFISRIVDGVKCHTDTIKIDQILINGTEQNLINLSKKNRELYILIKGRISTSKKIAFEFRLIDGVEKPVAFFSPSQVSGVVKTYQEGVFEIMEKVILPNNLTSGEFYGDIDLLLPNIEGYISIRKHIKILIEGLVGVTGIEFNYSECGLLIL